VILTLDCMIIATCGLGEKSKREAKRREAKKERKVYGGRTKVGVKIMNKGRWYRTPEKKSDKRPKGRERSQPENDTGPAGRRRKRKPKRKKDVRFGLSLALARELSLGDGGLRTLSEHLCSCESGINKRAHQ
jgi:hypothetical protein